MCDRDLKPVGCLFAPFKKQYDYKFSGETKEKKKRTERRSCV